MLSKDTTRTPRPIHLSFRRVIGFTSIAVLLVVLCPVFSIHANAPDKFPSRPIRLVTPFAPGGGSDILARLIAPRIHEAWGQSVIVDNRGGGGGTLGAGIVVNAPPDGYTLILVSGSYGSNAPLHRLPYDSVTGIKPIILTPVLATWCPRYRISAAASCGPSA